MAKKFSTVLIIYRTESSEAKVRANDLCQWLKDKGLKVYSHSKQTIKGALKVSASNLSQIKLTIVLGGDGTYLEAVRLLKGRKVPILGINMGSLGFLTETRLDDLHKAVELTLNGKMEMRPRSMIDLKVRRNGKTIVHKQALNDVVIERGARSHLINISLLSGTHLVNDIKADGLIIATPTGSTAYNLAAGGPILHPEVDSFVVTPICAHSLTTRPLIFSDKHKIVLRLKTGNQKASLTVDGQPEGEVTPRDEITITRFKNNHYVLRKPSHNYFNLLREKLKFGERA